MERGELPGAARALQRRHSRKTWQKVVMCLAAIVAFCTTYALILPAITLEQDKSCGKTAHTHTDACYATQSTLICDLPERPVHTHTEECYTAEQVPVCPEDHEHTDGCYETQHRLACGLEETEGHTHTLACHENEEVLICGMEEHVHTEACDPEEEPEGPGVAERSDREEVPAAQIFQYEDNTVSVSVRLPEAAAVPEDAVLAVRAITDTDDDYADLTRRAEEAVEGEAAEIVLYDISFYTAEEEHIPSADTATVSIRFNAQVMHQRGNVSVLHYASEAEAPVPLEQVTVELDEDTAVSALTFQTDGFSVFAVVNAVRPAYEEIPVTADTVLDGNAFWLINCTYNRTLSNTETTGNGVQKVDTGGAGADWSGLPQWSFSKNTDNTYLIFSGGQYLTMDGSNGDMGLTGDASQATHFTVTPDRNMLLMSDHGYYINNWENDSGAYFAGYGQPDTGSLFRLYQPTEPAEGEVLAANPDGEVSAVADLDGSQSDAMTAVDQPLTDAEINQPGSCEEAAGLENIAASATMADQTVGALLSVEQNVSVRVAAAGTDPAGPELPQTGGAGTTFYTLGGLLLMGAAGCLLRRKTRAEREPIRLPDERETE